MVAVLTGISAALPPDAPSIEVVRTVHRLDGGTPLDRTDLTLARLPVDAVPAGALTRIDAAVGQTLRAPLSSGQVLTDLSVVSPGRSVRAGHVVAPLRLADADLAALLHEGDAVDVLAADSEAKNAVVVAHDVRVVGLPQPPDLSGVGAASSVGALVLVEVDSATATLLAQAAVSATLSVVLR
jgi:pilus assembly protein CpaB